MEGEGDEYAAQRIYAESSVERGRVRSERPFRRSSYLGVVIVGVSGFGGVWGHWPTDRRARRFVDLLIRHIASAVLTPSCSLYQRRWSEREGEILHWLYH